MSDLRNPEVLPPSRPDPIHLILAILVHVSPLISLPIIIPLVIYFTKKDTDPLLAKHAMEALNFQISYFVYTAIAFVLVFVLIGFVLLWILAVLSVIFIVIACIKATDGVVYRYPLTFRLL